MLKNFLIQVGQGWLRHLLTTAAGALLVSHGLLSNDQASQGVGAVMLLVGLGISAWDKRDHFAAPQQLPAVPSALDVTADDLNKQEFNLHK